MIRSLVRAALSAVRPRRVRIRYAAPDPQVSLHGMWDPDSDPPTITVDPSLPPDVQQLVLMHELLHAADDLSSRGEQRIEHDAIARIAPELLALLSALGCWGDLTPQRVRDAAAALPRAGAR